MLYEKICTERQRLEQKIALLQRQIYELPEGKLFCTHSGRYTKWYQSNGHHSTYIPKKNRTLAEQLALKKYLSLCLEELLQERRALDFYLRHHAASENSADQLLADTSAYSELLSPYFTPKSQELHNWMTQPFDCNPIFPEQRIHKTSAGIMVRSKSEALIAYHLSGFYHSPSANRRILLLRTFRNDGQSQLLQKCFFQTTALYFSRHYSFYTASCYLRNQGASSGSRSGRKSHSILLSLKYAAPLSYFLQNMQRHFSLSAYTIFFYSSA